MIQVQHEGLEMLEFFLSVDLLHLSTAKFTFLQLRVLESVRERKKTERERGGGEGEREREKTERERGGGGGGGGGCLCASLWQLFWPAVNLKIHKNVQQVHGLHIQTEFLPFQYMHIIII